MKVKVILDADVIIHFIKGDCLSLLPQILPSYEFCILDIVYNSELSKNHKTQIENTINLLRSIAIIEWNPSPEEKKEFAILTSKFGIGESASMIYCKFHNDLLASSNMKDIISFCQTNGITYFTTMDFLYQAMVTKIMSETECNEFISKVLLRGSKLPVKNIGDYRARLIL